MSAIPSAGVTPRPMIFARRFAAHPGDHRFFSAMAIVSSLTIVAGFLNTYGPKVMTGEPALPFVIHPRGHQI